MFAGRARSVRRPRIETPSSPPFIRRRSPRSRMPPLACRHVLQRHRRLCWGSCEDVLLQRAEPSGKVATCAIASSMICCALAVFRRDQRTRGRRAQLSDRKRLDVSKPPFRRVTEAISTCHLSLMPEFRSQLAAELRTAGRGGDICGGDVLLIVMI